MLALSEKATAILILALPGAGKTSLMTCLMEKIYEEQGRELLKACIAETIEFNKARGIEPFELPEQPPIYADIATYKVKFKVGYNKWFTPYVINPYYMGLTNDRLDTLYTLPYGVVFIPEIQRYSDARQSFSFPLHISKLFEIRRHFNLKFIMDGHQGTFVDKKIREVCNCIIELIKQEHDKDELGRIQRTRWYCREFPSYDEYELFTSKKNKGEDVDVCYEETVYEHEFEIFDDYDSRGCKKEFVPPLGKQFNMLPALSPEEIAKLSKDIAKFYDLNEPKGFRSK